MQLPSFLSTPTPFLHYILPIMCSTHNMTNPTPLFYSSISTRNISYRQFVLQFTPPSFCLLTSRLHCTTALHAKSYSHDYSGKYDCCDSQQTTATTPPTTYSSPQPGYVPGQFKLEVKPFPSARGQMPSRTSSDRSHMCFICCARKAAGPGVGLRSTHSAYRAVLHTTTSTSKCAAGERILAPV